MSTTETVKNVPNLKETKKGLIASIGPNGPVVSFTGEWMTHAEITRLLRTIKSNHQKQFLLFRKDCVLKRYQEQGSLEKGSVTNAERK